MIKKEILDTARADLLKRVTSDEAIREEAAKLINDDLAHAQHLRDIMVEAAERLQATSLKEAVLVMRAAGDATGARSADPLRDLRNEVIARIVGKEAPSDWGGETIGVFRLSRGELLSMSAGTLIYQLDFAIDDQLRI